MNEEKEGIDEKLQEKIKELLKNLYHKDSVIIDFDVVDELASLGNAGITSLKAEVIKDLPDIEFEIRGSEIPLLDFLIEYFGCEVFVEYLDNIDKGALRQVTYDTNYYILGNYIMSILKCFEAEPSTKSHLKALNVIKKLDNNLLQPLCWKIYSGNNLNDTVF